MGCPLFYNVQSRSEVYTVGQFMTKKEDLHVVKPTTSVEEGTFYPEACLG